MWRCSVTAELFWEYSPMRSIRMWRCRSILETSCSCLRMESQRPRTLAVKNTVRTDCDRNLMTMLSNIIQSNTAISVEIAARSMDSCDIHIGRTNLLSVNGRSNRTMQRWGGPAGRDRTVFENTKRAATDTQLAATQARNRYGILI